jgi:O-antigen biosynthesis protein WbqP
MRSDKGVDYPLKRGLDIGLAILLAPVAVLLLASCVVALKLVSPGPAIFRQVRVGKGEKPFVCLKLRTMVLSAAEVPTHEISGAAVTPLGRWLRRFKLDELPQLWNILRGDMSFVGPRPCLQSQHDLILERRIRGVYGVRPGLTGLAQIRGIDMSTPELLAQTDAEYVKRMSLWTDVRVIVGTVIGPRIVQLA